MASQRAANRPDEVYTRPRYAKAEAARIIAVPTGTFRNWAHGYTYRTLTDERSSSPLITLAEAGDDRLMVPFIGLAEAHVLAAFRETKVPMQRIRPALEKLQSEMGLPAALANRRLKSDGAEILYDYGRRAKALGDDKTADALSELVVVRSGQRVFTKVVQNYLTTITYAGDWINAVHLRRFGELDVVVDPLINYGKPTLADRGVRVVDVVSRVRAGEPPRQVAWDYDLDEHDVLTLAQAA